ARAENRVAAVQVAAVGEGISRGLPARSGCKGGGAWLRGLVPVAPYVAHQRAALAVELPAEELAPTREAFAAGAIAAGYAAAVCRTLRSLDRFPEVDGVTWGEAQRLLVAESGAGGSGAAGSGRSAPGPPPGPRTARTA